MVFQFLIHALCATGVCLPHFKSPSPISNSVGLRSGDDDFIGYNPPIAYPGSGSVEGIIMKTIKGRSIGAFMGIPYALPPVDQLRFQPPKPMEKWEGIRIANKTSQVCLQVDIAQYFYVQGREDCLYLNVYTPKLPKDGIIPKLPVIVYIHGGAYLFGGGSDLGPSYLLDNDVLLVTFNYRLGVLGFLSTGDSVQPGNNGMKDQALALQWVQNNIEGFGGDPNRITFMGQSAGASSVNLHLMSPLTKHIPYTAIMHSGSAHQEWSIVNSTVKNSKIIADSFKCPTSNSIEMVECLRNQNPYFIVFRQMKTFKEFFYPTIPFGPVVELPSPGAFLVQHPKDAYKDGNVRKIPAIVGLVENEGDLFTFETVLYPGLMKALNRKWYRMAPYVLDYHSTSSNPDSISQKVREYYFGNRTINFYSRDRISKMLGDRWIVTGVHKAMQFHSSIAPTYGFQLSYKGKYSVAKPLSLNRADWGVTHLDDIGYLINSTLYFEPMELGDPEFTISEFMTNVWSNFARTGKPYLVNENGDDINFWKSIDNPLDINLIDINDKVREIKFPFQDRIKFWNNLKFSDDYSIPKSLLHSTQIKTTTTTTVQSLLNLNEIIEDTTTIYEDIDSKTEILL